MPLQPDALADHLAERTRAVGPRPVAGAGAYILYWMRAAARGHENPALDVALEAGRQLGVPVFVYHALDERYPYASTRVHTFAIEGARDAQAELRARGVGCAFHLERPGHRGPHLKALGRAATLIVTDEMPVAPFPERTRSLVDAVTAPIWLVDTACVLPMRLVEGAHERAFEFRQATDRERRSRLERLWTDAEPASGPFVPDLPFEPVELSSADLAALVATCDIDHSVAPVPDATGGARAGYARWNAFRQERLARYATDRHDPLRASVSRLSPYLHFGHVSPFRIAREALASGTPGADTFLDEFLTWRELGWCFCSRRDDHATLEALPEWARQTLVEHARDPRPAIHDRETLARGRTGDALWDAAQRSLLVHGELHNSLRMTWGKAVIGWRPTPADALQTVIDLNHRYALDGRDPSSYAGILWCFGQFDRPFTPERPVLGTVRPRPTGEHARRLDVARYAEWAGTRAGWAPSVVVVGAGMAGLACARTLADHGIPVRVFDKGRRPGGRVNTREMAGWQFDHGAQFFTARDPVFRRHVDAWRERGLVALWDGRLVAFGPDGTRRDADPAERFVAVPGMQALAAHLARDLDVTCSAPVASVGFKDGGWRLFREDETEIGGGDYLVLALPAPQAASLVEHTALSLDARAILMAPCWTVMLGYEPPLDVEFDGAFVAGSTLAWMARDASKPGRPARDSWVLQASPEWSMAHLDDEPGRVTGALVETFADVTGRAGARAFTFAAAHRWRYALATLQRVELCLFDPHLGIGLCGDWCGGARVEGAFQSGLAMASRLLGSFGKAFDSPASLASASGGDPPL